MVEVEMVKTVRAVYEKGKLRLLVPLDLQEGVEVDVTIQTPRERMRQLLESPGVEEDDNNDLEDVPPVGIFDTYATQGKPLSQIIIEEREQSP